MADLGSGFEQKSPYTDGTPGLRPTMTPQLLWRDVGSSGLRQYSGWIREEFLRALQGREAQRVYREMRDNSATVGALLFAITQSMRKIEWNIVPASSKPEAVEKAEFVESIKDDMSHTWDELITEALSCLTFGFAAHEIVWKRRTGYRRPAAYNTDGKLLNLDDDIASSKYNDGLIGVRRLPLRGQETILSWFLDGNGAVTGMRQQPWTGPIIDIPIEKLLIFRPTFYKGNPEGYSVLRTAYRSYFFLKRIEEEQAILLERMNGLPVLRLPSSLLEGAQAGDQNSVAALEMYKKMVTNIRIDEQMGLILPSDTWPGVNGPSNVPMFEFNLVSPTGSGMHVDSDKVLQRYSLDILKTVLADFIDLGHQARGTQNLAVSKVDLFMQALAGWLGGISSVFNRYMLTRLWQLNAFDFDLMPRFEPDITQRLDLDILSNFVLRLTQAGVLTAPDPGLEDWLRSAAGMPDRVEEATDPEITDEEPTPEAAAGAFLRQAMLAIRQGGNAAGPSQNVVTQSSATKPKRAPRNPDPVTKVPRPRAASTQIAPAK